MAYACRYEASEIGRAVEQTEAPKAVARKGSESEWVVEGLWMLRVPPKQHSLPATPTLSRRLRRQRDETTWRFPAC